MLFENRVLRRIFDPWPQEVTGGWRKWYNEELHNMYFSPVSKMVTWMRLVVHMWEMRNV
jgi:hypothetical protein